MTMTKEKISSQSNGWTILVLDAILIGIAAFFFVAAFSSNLRIQNGYYLFAAVLLSAIIIFTFWGFFTLEPNEAAILLLFGKYVGTEKTSGFRWAFPFYQKKKVSLRIRNFDSEKLKVNDKRGNPIEISAIIVWRVVDTAEAEFKVDNFIDYVHMQSESAIRHLAMAYSYDNTNGEQISLRSSIEEVSKQLQVEITKSVNNAGVEILDARINHLAYSPEIAHAMLQRQQAEAVIAARTKIVDGAVGMVEMALEKLSKNNIVDLDEERKATLVGNLMLVLTSDKDAQPVINAGSIY